MATSARLEELQHKFNENPRRYFAPLANEHRKLGDLDQAIALCRTHLPQQPQHVSGYIVLAQALFEAGNTPDARSTFEDALDLDPENLIALRYLGDIARAQGEHLTARQLYERVLDADPRNDEIAQLIREMERDESLAPAEAAEQPEPVLQESSAENDQVVAAAEPNEAVVEAALPEPQPEPIEDLATAWQHEVAALEAPSEPQMQEEQAAEFAVEESQFDSPESHEPSYEEPEPIAEVSPAVEELSQPEHQATAETDFTPMETLESDLSLAAATIEPNEPWAEPDADFVASVPTVEPAVPDAAMPFAEIDYSVFEAVADEEAVAPEEPLADAVDAAEPFAEIVAQAPPALEETNAEPVAQLDETSEPAAAAEPPADDWFATPSTRDIEPVAAETSGETTFDLDAAFQQVLPNNGETPQPEELLEVPQNALEDFSDLPLANELEASSSDRAQAENDFPLPAMESGDSVDDAFAELDRMTASLDGAATGAGMLLPDEQYATQSPTEEIEAPEHVDALIGRTPDSGVPVVEEAPAAFVTETMAELYLQQGFREEALAVYRQLLVLNPSDTVLASRVASLEGAPAAGGSADDATDLPTFRFETSPATRADAAGQSVRSFLGVFARRRAPMRRRQPAIEEPPAAEQVTPLSALFGAPHTGDDASAAVIAGAFTAPNGESHLLPGRPTRAAVEELRLGDVFGSSAPASARRGASFDEFFSSGSAEQPAQAALDEEGSDMVQFTAWLEGLKRK